MLNRETYFIVKMENVYYSHWFHLTLNIEVQMSQVLGLKIMQIGARELENFGF